MPHLEPTYLRYIYDGLIKGSIHPENAAELPEGLIGLYEEAFDERTSVVERQKLLQRFAIWALLKKEVSAAFVAEVIGETEDEIQQFISTYSAWFNSPESGKYQLYHERLKVYLLQKLSEKEIYELHEKLILRLEKAIEEQKADEFEWYGLEFLGYHLSLHFHLNLNQRLIEKIKNLAENGFIERQIIYSGRYNWTFDFYHHAIASFELCDDRFKYYYYYKLLKYQLEEESRVEQIIHEIEDFPAEIIIESIENLGNESLFEKQQQFTAYFNAIFNLLSTKNTDIEKLTVVNSKLEQCTIELLNECNYSNISFFPYPLALLLGAKLSSLKFDIDYLFEHHEIYRYIYGTITQFDEKHLFQYLNLNPKDYFQFIDKLSSKIEKTLASNGKKVIQEEESYDPDLWVRLYWDLKIKQLDSLLYSTYEFKHYNEFYHLLNKLNTSEIERCLSRFPSNLDGTLAKNIYRKLEGQRQFKGCYLAIQHFEELNSEDELASIDLILSENIFSPETIWILLLNKINIDPNKLNSFFDLYVDFIAKNRFDYNVMDELFSNCFQLYASNRFSDIKKVNEMLFSEKYEAEFNSLPYSNSLYLLRFFENHGGVGQLDFKDIIDLKKFDLSFLAENDKQVIRIIIVNKNLEDERELFLKNRDSHNDPNDYYTTFELSVCELAIKLGFYDLVFQIIPKIHFEFRFELLLAFSNSKIDKDLAKSIDAIICLDERKFGLDSDLSAEKLKLRVLTKTLFLGHQQFPQPRNLFDIKENKVELSSFDQENYILNFGKVHLENNEIQRAIDLLPVLMNYTIPSLSFEIAFTILKINRNWEEFDSISNEMLAFMEEQHDRDYGSFNLKIDSKIRKSKLETILSIAHEINTEPSLVISTLMLFFDLQKLPYNLTLDEISNFKGVNQGYLRSLMHELISNKEINRNPVEQIYLVTMLPTDKSFEEYTSSTLKHLFASVEPIKSKFEDLLKIYENAEVLIKFYPNLIDDFLLPIAQSRENDLDKVLLLGLLPQSPIVRDSINLLLKHIPSNIVINETDGKSLSYFLQFKTKLKDLSIVPILENIAYNHKFSIYTFWDEDGGMFFELPHVKSIIGKSTLVRKEVAQFNSEIYTENGIWHSDNEHVAIVDNKGLVTAIGIGKANITLTVNGVYSSISNSNYKPIEVIVQVTETVAERLIQNELGKPVDQINFSPILYNTMKDKKKFREMIEQHAVYKTCFPELEENYLELAHELFDLTWMNFTQETN